ncbi:hypothetical protein ACT3XG_04405 [Paenibacillus polymyxa]|uniref:hypothetical protein n=1 Tax=Paenibacillus TaxID=44249 RepID=UPI001CD23106|nr:MULTISPECIES: hypothetical protein [Paenibacillus]MBZ6441318.1 hypothetical protein [Paenibacillus polymyxa]MBZ6451464.1 hypothetical protein [Paenibacillus polymyxa]MCJ1220996.1 hypothetical protein [Paenibacillus polymyxa]MDG0055258.1 hypothetical protein [Paenibacillus sp. P2(2022)]MDN4084326.1 hypothetical protein [Paenibacillus polymyxa]
MISLRKATLVKIRKAEAKLGKKLKKRSHVVMNVKKAIRVTQLGDGFARFTFAPVTISPNSFRSTTINGNDYNLISGSWIFSGNQQGFLLDNYSAAEDRWFFTAWNPTGTTRTVSYAVIAKRKP